jgi:hypothetical protein
MGFLAKYYGNRPNDTIYQVLWAALKKYSDNSFEDICKKIIQTFRPTSQTPFPLVPHFLDAVDEISNNQIQYPGRPLYLDHKEELADEATLLEIQEMTRTLSNKLSISRIVN